MKAIISSFFCFFLISGVLFSQKPITINEDSIRFSSKKFPGFIMTIPEVNFQTVQKNWIKTLQKSTKSDVTIEKDEMTIFGANIKDISETPINLYSKLSNNGSEVQLAVIIELKKDQYLEKETGEAIFLKGKNYLKTFAKEQYIDFAKDELQVEQKKLNTLKNELESLQKDKSDMQKSIQSGKTTINEETENINLKNTELNTVTAEIYTQTGQLDAMEEGETKMKKKEYIADLEKRKKKLFNAIESSKNKISKANNEIEKCNSDIPRNESKQEDIRPKIFQQESVVQKYSDKLNSIKAY